MIGFIIFLIVAIIVLSIVRGQFLNNINVLKLLNNLRIVAAVAILFAILFASIIQIGPGEVGVQILFGNVQDKVLRSGLIL